MRNAARLTILLAATFLLAGCFTADRSLYGDRRPVTPLHAGGAEVRDPGHPGLSRHDPVMLVLENSGFYRLINNNRHDDSFGEDVSFRLFPLENMPSDMLVAEIRDSCKSDDRACEGKPGRIYALVRLTQNGVEWRSPDCSAAMSKLSGIPVKIDNCGFSDRAGLEKALRIAAVEPWKPDGIYVFTDLPR